jgi:hypothetical protein
MKGDSSMSHAITRGLAMAIATAPFLIACGGGKADNPGTISSPQCSGSSCGVQGPPPTGSNTSALCPATADIVKTTFLGGAGSGEVVRVNIDATAMTYTPDWSASSKRTARPVSQSPQAACTRSRSRARSITISRRRRPMRTRRTPPTSASVRRSASNQLGKRRNSNSHHRT